MLTVSKNLEGLVRSHSICSLNLVEEFSIRIHLDRKIRRMNKNPSPEAVVTYGSVYEPSFFFEDVESIDGFLQISPQENILGCSQDVYTMPSGYFGLVQTKGSLARLFVSTTCNDGQIEPGYKGKITLEITNHASFAVRIPLHANIAQLFIFRCSTDCISPYQGRYQNADAPTLAKFE